MRGQRFRVSTEDSMLDDAVGRNTVGIGLVSDIKERHVATNTPLPSPPRPPISETGFPAHKQRHTSKFKRSREAEPLNSARQPHQRDGTTTAEARVAADRSSAETGRFETSIDEENKSRLAQMTSAEIAQARSELLSGLSPSLIEKLLKKARVDEDEASDQSSIGFMHEESSYAAAKGRPAHEATSTEAETGSVPPSPNHRAHDTERPPLELPPDLYSVGSKDPLPPLPRIHFPRVPVNPDLDPNDPDFLSKLHSIYFPSLPLDPSSMAWMAPVKPKEQDSYSPAQESLAPSSLRFNFRGHLLPPRLSSQIPSAKGLHHHGHTPESAGYTIPELAHLGRSTVTSQRCIAYQTLGRILYRLGRGDFGMEDDDLYGGMWQLVEKEKVLQGLVDAAGRENEGSRSLWATATDAIWLWRKGGGRTWKGR